MNEFEYLKAMRALRSETPPARELWPAIAKAITADEPRAQIHPLWSAVAAVALVCIGMTSLQHSYVSQPVAQQPSQRWRPHDPRLSAAAIDLNAAQLQLTQALDQSPDSTYLQNLLDRTQRQQRRLQQLARPAI